MKSLSTNQSKWACFVIIGILLFWNPIQTQAAEKYPVNQEGRWEAMDREMRCIVLRKAGDIPWEDVCAADEDNIYRTDALTDGDDPILDVEIQTLINDYEYAPDDEDYPIEDYGAINAEIKRTKRSLMKLFDRKDDMMTIEFGAEMYMYTYEEPGVMNNEGLFYGIFSSLTKRTSRNKHVKSLKDVLRDNNKINMYRLDFRFAFGTVDYESDYLGVPVTIDDIPDWMLETRGIIGYDIPLEDSVLTPYIGLGYRYLNDDSSEDRQDYFIPALGQTINLRGYERESNYFYVPIGVEWVKQMDKTWSVKLNAEFDILVYGLQVSHLEDTDITILGSDGNLYTYDSIENMTRKKAMDWQQRLPA
jgi:hypothetical protein